MSLKHVAEPLLVKAVDQEKEYQWIEAARTYQSLLDSRSDATSVAETWERIAFCYCEASRQASDLSSFRKLRRKSASAYGKAAELFGKVVGGMGQGRCAQCNALTEYASSWVASDPGKKRRLLDQCLEFGSVGLEAYQSAGDELEYGKMCNYMLLCLLERLNMASDFREIRQLVAKGAFYADKAIAIFSRYNEKSQLVHAYFLASLQSWFAANFSASEEELQEKRVQDSINYSEKALELSQEIDDVYSVAMSNWAAAYCNLVFTEKADLALQCADEMLRQGVLAKDNYLKGIASYLLGFITDWMMLREADSDRKKEGHEKVIKYCEDALRYFEPLCQDYFIAETDLFYAESYSALACDFVVNPKERVSASEKAVHIGREGLLHARRSGSADATASTLHALSKALHSLSNFENRRKEKRALLEEALLHREEMDKVIERAFPSTDWIRGVNKAYEGLVQLDLAKIEETRSRRETVLETAVSHMEVGVSKCKSWIRSRPVPAQIVATAMFEDQFGAMLMELYSLTLKERTLERAIEAYNDAAAHFRKANLPSRAAESYWKMARIWDTIGEREKAAEDFGKAFADYKAAALAIPNFAHFYLDYAKYMNAWGEIEKAKIAHNREDYSLAMEQYKRTARLLETSKMWNYLSANFLAWSALEQAEDLSRKESTAESIDAFERAAELFEKAGYVFEKAIPRIQNLEEREKLTELRTASARRKEYCLARVQVEEARKHDREGSHARSAQKYGMAASALEKIARALPGTKDDQKEIRLIAYMCRAWQKKEIADSKVSPRLYREASELFLNARAQSTLEKTTFLVAGNSAFCRALEYGTRFETLRKRDDFTNAKRHLESAASYYQKAGLDNASRWTTATEVLLDAYGYMLDAEIAHDPTTKMSNYQLAEKCLERSAALYQTAGYSGKKEEICRTLATLKEKRQFALSLGNLVTTPSDASSARAVFTPQMTIEEPVGVSKFDHAFIQANFVAHPKEMMVGEKLRLEFQLVNLGKNSAFLTEIDGIVPEGFALIEKPEKCAVDDGAINLKGGKLAALETKELVLTLKSKKKGIFTFTPNIRYMDECGEHRYCRADDLSIAVKELGIRGWLKGAS